MPERSELTNIKELKSPKGSFILGHLPQFKTSGKHLVIERWVEEAGNLFKINFLGKEFVVSADPKINNQILKLRPHQFKRFSKIDEIFREMGIIGIFNAEGETWKRHRKPITEALNVQKVKEYYPVIVDNTEKLLKKFRKYEQDSTHIDVQKEFMAYTIDITTKIAFGYELDTINNKANEFQKHLEVIFPMINQRITAPIPYWRLFKKEKDKKLDLALKSIEKIIYKFIDEAKNRLSSNPELEDKPSNFLEALLVENKDSNFSDEEVYGNVFSMLLAGEDTTSNSISWAMFYLAQHPEIVKKIREEAIAIYPNSDVPVDHTHFSQLKYTNSVAQEAIRLKPTTPQLYVESIEDVIVENVLFPKNTRIILANKVPQTKENYFSNADQFIPERWMENGCPMHEKHSPHVIKAFGGGARYCPGMHLAMNEMVSLISSFCKHFDFELMVNPKEVTEEFAFTMHPGGLLIKMVRVD